MKPYHIALPALLAASSTALAWPYTGRQLPAGFNAPVINVVGADNFSATPVAADFRGDGHPQWYSGGNVISKFPVNGVTTLPVITINPGFPTSVRPIAGIPCDVDRDGDPDIVRINTWNGWDHLNTFQVFVNQGGGSFTAGYRLDWDPVVPASTGAHLFQLAGGDFDRDGDQDVAVLQTYRFTNYDANPYRDEGTLYIRWNDGTGAFATATTLQTRGFSSDALLGAGDLDNDGDLDLAANDLIGRAADDTVTAVNTRLYTNNGAGSFAASSFPVGHPARFADLNRDGWLDMASRNTLAYNDGAGHMGSQVNAGVDDILAVADVNDDSVPDLIHASGNSLVYRKGSAVGGFNAGDTIAALPAAPEAAGVADGDGDGDMDILVNLRNGATWFLENRSLHQLAGATAAVFQYVPGVTELQTADFNLDGYADLLAVAPSQEKIWFMFGQGNGAPAAGVFKNTSSEQANSAAVADFDRDGRPDVAYTLPVTGQVRLALNTGNVPFSWSDSAIATGLTGVSLIVPGQHATPNGFTDLLTANGTNGQLRWLYQSSGAWQGQTVLSSFNPVPRSIMAVQATSGPGDEPFLLAASSSTLYLRGYQLTPTWVTAGTNRAESVASGPHANSMVWADANRDGEKDIVFITGTGALGVYNPVSTARYDLGTPPAKLRDIAAVDWDRNGYTDFLCATSGGLCLFQYRLSTGLWERRDLVARTGGFTSVIAMDMNRDDYMDAAAADTATGQVHFIRNVPRLLDAVVGPAATADLAVGEAGNALEFTARSAGLTGGGTWLPDVDAVITQANILIRRAVPSGGSWVPGTALTSSELSAAASSISLMANGIVIGSSGPAAISNGNLTLNYHTVLGNLVPVSAATTQSLGIRLTVTPGALAAPVTRFYVSLLNISGYARGGDNIARNIALDFSGPTTVLVTIVPDYTPLQAWRADYFGAPDGTGLRANDADYDNDGVSNLMEYLTGTNPAFAEPPLNAAHALTLLPFASSASALRLRFIAGNAPLTDPKVRVSVQTSTGLTGWTTVASRTGGTSWTGSQPVIAVGSTHTTMEFTPGSTTLTNPRLFFRLKAEELP